MARCLLICLSNACNAAKKAHRRTCKGLFRLSCALSLTIATTGCSSKIEQDVFDLPCGEGRLVLHEAFVPGFSIDKVTLELRYHTSRDVRLVAVLQRYIVLYRDPAPIEHYRHFRGGGPSDQWPVFVSPKRFTLAEYDQISQTLSDNLSVIDAAVERRDKPTKRLYDKRKPKISSIRYIDSRDLHKLYDSPDKRFKIEVNLNGQVFLLSEGMKLLITKSSIGYVAGNGSKVVLDPNPEAVAFGTDNIVTDLHTFVQQCVNVNGRSLHDDFVVEVSSSTQAYRLERQAWMRRRDSRR